MGILYIKLKIQSWPQLVELRVNLEDWIYAIVGWYSNLNEQNDHT